MALFGASPHVSQGTSVERLRRGYTLTEMLIVVGVALDTLQQIESHLLMRSYEGFVRKGGRIRGRRA